MKYQRGVSLSGLLFWGILLALLAVFGMRVIPSTIDYYRTLKACKSIVASLPPTATYSDVRKAYVKYQTIDNLDLKAEELEIEKNKAGEMVISFGYDKKMPLFGPVSLLIEYRGSTSNASKE